MLGPKISNILKITHLPHGLPIKQKKYLASRFYFNKFRALIGVTSLTMVANYNNSNTVLVSESLPNQYNNFALELKSLIKNKKSDETIVLSLYWHFLYNNKFYKGLRYKKGLPVRGQRTHTNYKTARKLNGI